MTKALVFENQVVDIAEQEFEVHESMTWYDAPSGCNAGWILEGGRIINPADQRTPLERSADALTELRRQRNKRLRKTDTWALSDRVMTQAQLDYRQALRNITEQYSSMEAVVWPIDPTL
jgi:hypothetical protein